MDSNPKRIDRRFVELPLSEHLDPGQTQPVLVVQSPKTPTLSRKLKAVSLDADQGQQECLHVSRGVASVPSTPKKQTKLKEPGAAQVLQYGNVSELGSNVSISGSQTLKTLPEVMTLPSLPGVKVEPVRIKAKGLLERRGSNASLTIDLGASVNLPEPKLRPMGRLNSAKSASNLNLTSYGYENCICMHKCNQKKSNHSEMCGNCTIYESVETNKKALAAKHVDTSCKCTLRFLPRYYIERHCVCNMKFRRKSLSNENLYVPPCNFCHFGSKDCHLGAKPCSRGSRKALYPRQTYIETSQLLSEDFKLHLQNIQYLQTAGSVLSIAELKTSCQIDKIPRLHQEFWEVPLNLQEKCLVSGSQTRNRYKGVLPNEHSRVHLPGAQPYIHANYIKGPDYTETAYIATQGPMLHTCIDFWHMVWNNKVSRVVMLTALIERGRSKCELYFPLGGDGGVSPKGPPGASPPVICATPQPYDVDTYPPDLLRKNTVEWGSYKVRYISSEALGECVVRKLELERRVPEPDTRTGPATPNSTGVEANKRIVYHYWYQNWADHKQANPQQVLQIALHVLGVGDGGDGSGRSPGTTWTTWSTSSSGQDLGATSRFPFDLQKSTTGSSLNGKHLVEVKPVGEGVHAPLVVHCSAGIGRTGCFLAVLNGIRQLRANYNVDILAIVCSLRLNRGGMVQTAEQYELIHRVLSLYADAM